MPEEEPAAFDSAGPPTAHHRVETHVAAKQVLAAYELISNSDLAARAVEVCIVTKTNNQRVSDALLRPVASCAEILTPTFPIIPLSRIGMSEETSLMAPACSAWLEKGIAYDAVTNNVSTPVSYSFLARSQFLGWPGACSDHVTLFSRSTQRPCFWRAVMTCDGTLAAFML